MAATIALLIYGGLAGTLGASALRRARWPLRAPRLAVATWQALCASIVVSLVLAGIGFWMPEGGWSAGLASLIHVCEAALRRSYAAPADAAVHLAGLIGALTVIVRVGTALCREVRRARRLRRRHVALLRVAARADADLGALVLDHPSAVAYCLPGRAGHVVLTSAAISMLDEDELAAVLVHERTHLRQHHHIVLAFARALERALPWLPGIRAAHREQRRLVEMIADDAAARLASPRAVARAVVRLAEGATPPPALAAADTAVALRVERMLAEVPPLGLRGQILVCATIALVAMAPFLVAAAPAVTAVHVSYCLIGDLAA